MSKSDEHNQGPPSYSNTQQQSYPPQQGYALQQGYAPQQGYSGQHTVVVAAPNPGLQGNVPDDYCTFSVLVTLFCCFWIGVFAILKSQAVREAIARGDLEGAQRNSAEALKMNKIGLGVGIGCTVLYVVLLVVIFVVAKPSYSYYRY